MSIFSKAKKLVKKVETKVGLRDEKRRPAVVDPDPINPLTGRPRSQDVPQDPMAGMPAQGLGQMQSYMPQPVSTQQQIPQGLGSNVFRSTLAPLQQQNYGLGQIDPRFLTGSMRLPGGSNAGIGYGRPPWMMQ